MSLQTKVRKRVDDKNWKEISETLKDNILSDTIYIQGIFTRALLQLTA